MPVMVRTAALVVAVAALVAVTSGNSSHGLRMYAGYS